jgi:demethylmenaquinone methyltransferase/2-methoxy-6-polyprenyl-1,4-benzoquinol methylase
MSATILPTKMPTPTAWNEQLLANPHAVADKRTRVQKMFAAIAPSYDLNNRLHSFWRDQAWRRRAVKLAGLKPMDSVVDVACGTGDLTLAFARGLERVEELQMPRKDLRSAVMGVDFTFEMLPIAVSKSRDPRPETRNPVFINGDAQSLPLPDACADVVSIAFGIRNVQSIPTALKEFRRILKPGGRVIILEFSKPTNPVLRVLNDFYCGKVMPITATLISRDKSGAYKYLPKSVDTFISREKMVQMMQDAGFARVELFPMTFGVCVCYRGVVEGA